ncbi:DUF4199 domain-containing protein [Hymenobacter cavernae]|uniref:DUF4199 domain-containing protein n=1 Tax=Hymenobacter cavernae TaxID=2044852 RepID=A0ABQ1UR45_9BACT|nr:DUF4199 domain-containing protein [Hymenobacter cavernae]GGF25108.1 hypothetical protein GCM10011383_40910 [Hymenobacter cavernae]
METTATPAVNPSSAAIRYGLVTGLIWIIVDFILRLTELSFKYSVYLGAAIIVYTLGTILAHKFFKQNNGGFMTYKQGMLIVLVISVIFGLLSGLFNYIYVNLVDPDYVIRMRADMEAWMSTLPNVTEAQIDKSLAGMSDEKVKSPLQIVKGLASNCVWEVFIGLIITAFTKHNRPEFE